jgi:hypothetical protein
MLEVVKSGPQLGMSHFFNPQSKGAMIDQDLIANKIFLKLQLDVPAREGRKLLQSSFVLF